jgi:hypothetical protein
MSVELTNINLSNNRSIWIPDISKVEINPNFNNTLEKIILTYKKNFDKNLISVFTKGTIAFGRELTNISDIDTIAIVSVEREYELKSQFKDYLYHSNNLFIDGLRNDFSIKSLSTLKGDTEKSELLKFKLKYFSKKIYGSNLSLHYETNARFSPLCLFENTIRITNKLDSVLENISGELTEFNKFSDTISKSILRSGFEISLNHVNYYSRDLSNNLNVFITYHENKKEIMKLFLKHLITSKLILLFYRGQNICYLFLISINQKIIQFIHTAL